MRPPHRLTSLERPDGREEHGPIRRHLGALSPLVKSTAIDDCGASRSTI